MKVEDRRLRKPKIGDLYMRENVVHVVFEDADEGHGFECVWVYYSKPISGGEACRTPKKIIPINAEILEDPNRKFSELKEGDIFIFEDKRYVKFSHSLCWSKEGVEDFNGDIFVKKIYGLMEVDHDKA